MPLKSFRARILDDTVQKLQLATNDGATGYRITKFQVINRSPGTNHTEAIIKIYKTDPGSTATLDVDFSDNTLLAVAYYEDSATAGSPGKDVIVFDNEVFNQDIFVTYKDNSNETEANYYIELEQMSLDLNQNTLVTLKDIRNSNSQ
tara:strand:+ start:227 stop:667 length:441 start_codon:yes stop_codon:yes gene_type:complete